MLQFFLRLSWDSNLGFPRRSVNLIAPLEPSHNNGALENLSYKMYQNCCMNPCWADSYWKTEKCVYCSFQFWCRVQNFYKARLQLVLVQNWVIEAFLYKPCWLDHFVPCQGFLYFCGTRQLTNQQIYIISVFTLCTVFNNI